MILVAVERPGIYTLWMIVSLMPLLFHQEWSLNRHGQVVERDFHGAEPTFWIGTAIRVRVS